MLYLNCVQELQDIRASNLKVFRDISVDDANILLWHGLIVPVSILSLINLRDL